jgi:hypothetical protein
MVIDQVSWKSLLHMAKAIITDVFSSELCFVVKNGGWQW